MIPPQLAILAAKHSTKALAILVLTVSLLTGYFYWKHEIVSAARDEVIEECNQSRIKFRIDAEHFKLARQEEVDKLNEEQSERTQNAIETYINHYEFLRNTPVATSLRIKTNCAVSAGSDTLPGSDKNRSAAAAESERTGEAELSEGNLRQLNEVISEIEEMQLKCERVINSVPE